MVEYLGTISFKSSEVTPKNYTLAITAIPRDTLPLDMLTPQIRHYELRPKNSSYATFSDLSPTSYAIF